MTLQEPILEGRGNPNSSKPVQNHSALVCFRGGTSGNGRLEPVRLDSPISRFFEGCHMAETKKQDAGTNKKTNQQMMVVNNI